MINTDLLWEQAKREYFKSCQGVGMLPTTPSLTDTFAELIVRECLNVMHNQTYADEAAQLICGRFEIDQPLQ